MLVLVFSSFSPHPAPARPVYASMLPGEGVRIYTIGFQAHLAPWPRPPAEIYANRIFYSLGSRLACLGKNEFVAVFGLWGPAAGAVLGGGQRLRIAVACSKQVPRKMHCPSFCQHRVYSICLFSCICACKGCWILQYFVHLSLACIWEKQSACLSA